MLSDYDKDFPDTTLAGFHNYFPRNFLGNVGLPSPEYIQRYGTEEIGFRLYELPYRTERFHKSDVSYYRSKGPYAELTGIAGSKQLQIFKLFFTHTFKKVNVSLRFNRYTSQGFYLRQQSFTNNFYLTSNYSARSRKAGYYFYFLNNGNRHNENGGIKTDTLSETALLEGKDILPVKLSNASRDNKQYQALFNPWLKLNNGSDTANKWNHFVQINSSFNTELFQYKDQGIYTDKYYLLMYHDTARTIDSSRVFKLMNAASYVLKTGNERLKFSAGYKHELNKVWQKADSLFSNHILQSDLVFRKKFGGDSSWSYRSHISADYVLNGVNEDDYKLETVNSFIKGSGGFYFNALYERRSADYIHNYWISNHFSWFNNGYIPQEKLQIKAAYAFRKNFGVSALLTNYNHYLYFDQVALPRQYSGEIQSFAANVFATKIFLRHIGLFGDYTWQSVSHSSLIRVPNHAATARIFYTGSHFKNNLVLNTGVQLQYFSSLYGYAYMPATNVFYLQEKYQTAPYPYVDIYVNARIRPVNFFLKIENVLQGFAGKNYSFVPGYFQPDRAFRFGISWMFFD